MIKILAKDYSQAVSYLCEKLDSDVAEYDLFLTKSVSSSSEFIRNAVKQQSLIIVGNVGDSCALFADTFSLAMFYDKFAEKNVTEFCKLSQMPMPAQHILDRICIAPETFNHFASSHGLQCSCYGEYNKCHVYMIPNDLRECSVVYENYFYKDYFKSQSGIVKYTFKVFGLTQREIEVKLTRLNKIVSRKYETINLDTKIVLSFPQKCAKSVVFETIRTMDELFGSAIYAKNDQSLAKTVVELLTKFSKTVSTAESVTGGMIASSLVDVAGASGALYEGVVCYSIASKCKRLGLSPHFIDEYGVVSEEVAKEMSSGLRKNGCDIAVSTTGYAGPSADSGYPVGLCYIAVDADGGRSRVAKFVFKGDRNSVRAQATNAALFMIYSAVTRAAN